MTAIKKAVAKRIEAKEDTPNERGPLCPAKLFDVTTVRLLDGATANAALEAAMLQRFAGLALSELLKSILEIVSRCRDLSARQRRTGWLHVEAQIKKQAE